ncbi:MAG TPA: winged helix-turn-helix domain-containing protein [Solirubrobacterales bacterium]|jgi:DNA-binding transcriptional ArsR family regulator|nr:winged helix-turn-helix domain-containing protein [Solirubrobacterales bacterium]
MATAKKKEAQNPTLGAVVAHPLRSQCLTFLAERTASPAELSIELGENLGNVSYHVRKLWKAGIVEIVEEKPVRGAMEHFYRAVTRPHFSDEDFENAPAEDRKAFSQHIFSLVTANATTALESGTFVERPDNYICRVPMRVDEEAWTELNELHAEMLERTLKIQEAAAGRLGGTEDTGFPIVAFNTFFEMPERKKAE